MRRFTALLCFLVAAVPLAAQKPADRAALDALADSAMAEPARAPRAPFDHLRNAQIFLARGTASGSSALLLKSADEAYEATVKRGHWPYAWYLLGSAKLRLSRLGAREIRSPHQPAGAGWLDAARNAFERALREEPTFGPAAPLLAETVLADLDSPGAEHALTTLRLAAASPSAEASTMLALSRLLFGRDSLEGAGRMAERYLGLGGEPGVGWWELARVKFAEGDRSRGTAFYFRAASRVGMTPVKALFRADLALAADSAELDQFDRSAPDSVEGWLREFWSSREVAAGRPANTRLPEHFRRVRYAHANFTYRGTVAQYEFAQVYRKAAPHLDDRGMIYIRQGEPDRRANYVGGMGTRPNESWLYFRPSGNLVLHFAEMGPAGWRMVESLVDIAGLDAARMYESRGGLDPSYLAIASLFEMQAAQARTRVLEPHQIDPIILLRDRKQGHAMIAVSTTTDADPIDLDRSWDPIAQVYGVGATAPGTAGLLTVIALPLARNLAPIPLPGGAAGYVIRLRTTAADDSGRTTLDVDSLVRLRTPRPLAKGQFLTIVRSYTLPAGTQRVRVIIADSAGAHGAVRVLSGVPAVDLSTPNLAMSDLVVGREESGVTWTAPNGTTIPLQPLNAWRTTDAMAINFEVSGLSTGEAYKIRIGLADLGADSTTPPKASVEFENQASGARELVTQSLSLRGVRPGRYLLTATITSVDKVIRRERRITVAAP